MLVEPRHILFKRCEEARRTAKGDGDNEGGPATLARLFDKVDAMAGNVTEGKLGVDRPEHWREVFDELLLDFKLGANDQQLALKVKSEKGAAVTWASGV